MNRPDIVANRVDKSVDEDRGKHSEHKLHWGIVLDPADKN
jgi:hypothetical protein